MSLSIIGAGPDGDSGEVMRGEGGGNEGGER